MGFVGDKDLVVLIKDDLLALALGLKRDFSDVEDHQAVTVGRIRSQRLTGASRHHPAGHAVSPRGPGHMRKALYEVIYYRCRRGRQLRQINPRSCHTGIIASFGEILTTALR